MPEVSKPDQAEVKADFWAIFDVLTAEPGEPAVAEARSRAAAFEATWSSTYPGALACLTDELDTLTTHLRFPREHHKRIRHTNLIERTLGESRRRVKVIGRLPGERSCLRLVWAVLERASRGWRGVVQTPANVGLLQQIRRDLLEPRAADDPRSEPVEHDLPDAVTAAAQGARPGTHARRTYTRDGTPPRRRRGAWGFTCGGLRGHPSEATASGSVDAS